MQLKSHKMAINFTFIFLLTLGVVGTWFLYYTNATLKHGQIYISYILDIRKLNDEIDVSMSSPNTIVNFDTINKKMDEMIQKLKATSSYKGFDDFFLDRRNKAIFLDFHRAVLAKKTLLEDYKTHKSSYIEGLIYLLSNLRNTKDVRIMSGLFTKLALIRFGDNLNVDEFEQEIATLHAKLAQSETHASVDYTYIGRLLKLNEEVKIVSNIEVMNTQLNISAKASNVITALNNYNNRNFTILLVGIFILGIIVLVFFVRILKYYFENQKLKKYTNQLDGILVLSDSSLVAINLQGQVIRATRSFKENNQQYLGKKLEFFYENGAKIEIINDVSQTKSTQKYNFSMRKNSKGNLIYEKIIAVPNFDMAGKLIDIDIILQDFTENYTVKNMIKRAKFKEKEASIIDRETELPNHLALNEMLKKQEHAHVLYISLDQFSNIVFFYNQATVLLILIEVGKTINLFIENNHLDATLYHLQEDKFCIYSKSKSIEASAKRLLAYFTPSIIISDDTGHDINIDLNITIGISLNVDTTIADRLTQAKLAHQKAKNNEENLAFYEQNDESEKNYRQNQYISRLIRYALNTNKIVVECQPIFDLQEIDTYNNTYKVHSYEILARMLDEQNKIHYPGEFLGVAKQAGLYLNITRAVIIRAFELINRFDYRFSINLSTADMINPSVRELLLQKLDESEHSSNVTIEVLETEDVEGAFDEVFEFLKLVRSHGCRVAIDDFGSGYANLAMLLELNVDYIKLDGSIVRRLPYDKDAVQLIGALASFTNTEGYTMVAEFVSEQEILDVVKSLGIRYAQGFLLGKPVTLN